MTLKEAIALVKNLFCFFLMQLLKFMCPQWRDVKHADQVVRSTTILPQEQEKQNASLFLPMVGKKQKQRAGADVIGGEDLIEKVTKEKSISTLPFATPK